MGRARGAGTVDVDNSQPAGAPPLPSGRTPIRYPWWTGGGMGPHLSHNYTTPAKQQLAFSQPVVPDPLPSSSPTSVPRLPRPPYPVFPDSDRGPRWGMGGPAHLRIRNARYLSVRQQPPLSLGAGVLFVRLVAAFERLDCPFHLRLQCHEADGGGGYTEEVGGVSGVGGGRGCPRRARAAPRFRP